MAGPTHYESEIELLPSQPDSERDPGASTLSSLYQKRWPDKPQKLKSNSRSDPLTTAFEVLLACFPIAFFVLGILVIRLDGREVSDYGSAIIQTTNLGPSIFPIVFAAIVGGTMQSYALWKAEKSATLGLLEQLNGSTSFAGTIGSVIALRRPDFLTVCIVLLWAMSPLGGQSTLRMVSQVSSRVEGNATLGYMSMNSSSGFFGSSTMSDALAPMNSIYTTSLISSEEAKASPRDAWGWPKIPLLRTLPSVDPSSNETNPWRAPSQDSPITYSSFLGHVVQGIPAQGDVEFPLESSYFDFDCHLLAHDLPPSEIFDRMGEPVLYHNATNLFRGSAYTSDGLSTAYSNFFLDANYYNSTAPSPTQSHLFYGSRDRPNEQNVTAALFNCTISTVYLEVWISCRDTSCAVSRMRHSPTINPDDGAQFQWVELEIFVSQFPHATGRVDPYQSSPTDSYIYGDQSLFSADYERDWSTVSAEDISKRLTTTFNTFWQVSLAPFTISSVSRFDPVNLTQVSEGFVPTFNGTTGTTSRGIKVYRTNPAWVAVFLVATIFLQLSAFAGLLMRSVTVAPDILGSVSSLTRDNPHFPLPAGGSTLSGLERARRLRDLRVQIADVGKDGEAGHIALVSRVGGVTGRNLSKRRWYA
ncbi:hypothetical protein BDW62DRAFT_197093 [Aspergillus aurantiobrunneus]